MQRRRFIKIVAGTPMLGLLSPDSVLGCSMGGSGIVIPSSQLAEPIVQSSFRLFANKYRKVHRYSPYYHSDKIKITLPPLPDDGFKVPCRVVVNDNNENSFCRKIYIYAESEGETVEQNPNFEYDAGVLWTHHIASYTFAENGIPDIALRMRHVGLLMSVGVVAEMLVTKDAKTSIEYLYNQSFKVPPTTCFSGALSSK